MATKKFMYLKIVFPPLLQQFWSVLNDCTHMNKSLVFGDEFLAHLKSHQRCSAGIRPVKFFHTDWIIISLWFLSYTQRHCHVRIEKSSVQTVTITLEAHSSLEYHYMLQHYDLYSWNSLEGGPNTFANIVYKVIWENSHNYNKYSQWWDIKWQFE